MTNSASNPVSIADCTNTDHASKEPHVKNYQLPLSTTLPALKLECDDRKSTEGSIRFPVEFSTLPSDGQDLLMRLLDRPDRRIRSIFALQRIAFFMGFNFDDARKKKVALFNFESLMKFVKLNRYALYLFSFFYR